MPTISISYASHERLAARPAARNLSIELLARRILEEDAFESEDDCDPTNDSEPAPKLEEVRAILAPFTVVLHGGRQFEVDCPGGLVQRDGVAIFLGPGGIPVIFDHEGVEHFTGDLANRPTSYVERS